MKFKYEVNNPGVDTRIVTVTANTKLEAIHFLEEMYPRNGGYEYKFIENEDN